MNDDYYLTWNKQPTIREDAKKGKKPKLPCGCGPLSPYTGGKGKGWCRKHAKFAKMNDLGEKEPIFYVIGRDWLYQDHTHSLQTTEYGAVVAARTILANCIEGDGDLTDYISVEVKEDLSNHLYGATTSMMNSKEVMRHVEALTKALDAATRKAAYFERIAIEMTRSPCPLGHDTLAKTLLEWSAKVLAVGNLEANK